MDLSIAFGQQQIDGACPSWALAFLASSNSNSIHWSTNYSFSLPSRKNIEGCSSEDVSTTPALGSICPYVLGIKPKRFYLQHRIPMALAMAFHFE